MNPFPATVNRTIIFGAACWTLAIVWFIGQAVAQAAFARPYSLATNLISDLGNTACGPAICSPLHAFANATFVAVGLMHTIGAIATYRAWPRRQSVAGIAALAIAGGGLVVVGLAPENVSATLGAHLVGAYVGLVCLNLSMILLGSTLLDAARPLGVLAMAAGVIGFIGFGMFVNRAGGVPIGLAERIADYPAAAMVVVLGGFLLIAAISKRQGQLRTI